MNHARLPVGGRPVAAPARPDASLDRTALPRWTPAAVAAGSVVLASTVGLLCGLQSRLQWGLIAALLFMAGTFALSSAVEGGRQARNRLATGLVWICFLLAMIPLAALIRETLARGSSVVDGYFLTHSMHSVITLNSGGGVYHALLGTVEQVGLATAMATPVGLLTAVYLVEYGRGALARAVTFFVDVMTGIPSIVTGLFILSWWIIMLDFGYSGFAGSMALAVLMMPIVVRATEEMLRLVPDELREASLALGVPKWRTVLRVVFPAAVGGIATGVMLAVARIAGETAPILLLVFGAQSINANPFHGAQSSLPYYVYEQWANGNQPSYERAWGAALVLIALVMLLNLLARGIARRHRAGPGR